MWPLDYFFIHFKQFKFSTNQLPFKSAHYDCLIAKKSSRSDGNNTDVSIFQVDGELVHNLFYFICIHNAFGIFLYLFGFQFTKLNLAYLPATPYSASPTASAHIETDIRGMPSTSNQIDLKIGENMP